MTGIADYSIDKQTYYRASLIGRSRLKCEAFAKNNPLFMAAYIGDWQTLLQLAAPNADLSKTLTLDTWMYNPFNQPSVKVGLYHFSLINDSHINSDHNINCPWRHLDNKNCADLVKVLQLNHAKDRYRAIVFDTPNALIDYEKLVQDMDSKTPHLSYLKPDLLTEIETLKTFFKRIKNQSYPTEKIGKLQQYLAAEYQHFVQESAQHC